MNCAAHWVRGVNFAFDKAAQDYLCSGAASSSLSNVTAMAPALTHTNTHTRRRASSHSRKKQSLPVGGLLKLAIRALRSRNKWKGLFFPKNIFTFLCIYLFPPTCVDV